ncbi:MAG TPA: ArgE/DapE family deacylase [Casimicrobiaceae bacterium]|nr:ArgE/DapE family deacylase [Casimicrobiaceae bacterium]
MPDIVLAIHDFLAAHRGDEDRFLAELVKVPSDNPPGDCAPHARRAAELLEAMGFTVERHVIPDDAVKANGMISCTVLVVRVRFGEGRGPVIALNAHGDVVAPGSGWTTDPYGAEVKDGTMYGRGAAVSKSDFATYAFALLVLRDAAVHGAAFDGTVELHLTYDEEVGGALGPQWLLQNKISAPDYAISAGFSYGITTAHNGCLHLQVDVAGKSGHAAEPEKGIDALEAATGILSELYALRKSYAVQKSSVSGIGSPTLVVGLIKGGINTNVVPDHVSFRIDRRIIPEENPAEVEATLTTQIREFAAKWPGIDVKVTRVLLAVPFVPIPGQEKLVAALRRHGRAVMGEDLRTHGVPIYTDARLYSTAGVPTVLYGAGPRTLVEANGHRADEKLKLDDLHRATEVVALALADMLRKA